VFAKPVGDFILKRSSLKLLALFFLIPIGVMIFMKEMHKHVPKAYIYLPMGFAQFAEALPAALAYINGLNPLEYLKTHPPKDQAMR